jgi:two-component system response regulator
MNSDAILLVEDNPDDIELTTRALRQNNINNELVVASDGEEALRYLLPSEGAARAPLLVLLDINIPKINGLEVLRILRSDKRSRCIPVVVLTTSNEERDIVESYELGANSYVRKPVAFESFLEAIRLLGLYWLLVNQRPVTTYRASL